MEEPEREAGATAPALRPGYKCLFGRPHQPILGLETYRRIHVGIRSGLCRNKHDTSYREWSPLYVYSLGSVPNNSNHIVLALADPPCSGSTSPYTRSRAFPEPLSEVIGLSFVYGQKRWAEPLRSSKDALSDG
jgi:hypothetical protein